MSSVETGENDRLSGWGPKPAGEGTVEGGWEHGMAVGMNPKVCVCAPATAQVVPRRIDNFVVGPVEYQTAEPGCGTGLGGAVLNGRS